MTSSAPNLDSIPAEIVKKIACFSSFTSVIALHRVSRRFHSLCNDPAVFKSILLHQNSFPDQELWDVSFLPSNTTEFAQYALADFKARERRSILHVSPTGDHDDEIKQRTLTWALKLVAHRHPFIGDVSIPSIVELFAGHGPAAAPNYGLNLILICAILQQSHAEHLGKGPSEEVFNRYKAIKTAMKDIPTEAFDSESPNVSTFALSLFLYSQRLPGTVSISLPSPLKIPFPTLVDLPPPFSESGKWADLQSSHLKEMTSKSFLESGEWVGYYSYNTIDQDSATYDPPMRGITFEVNPHPDHDTVMVVEARGVDSVGGFEMAGIVESTGGVFIEKLYYIGYFWQWKARMTPFGIVGTWGNYRAGGPDKGSLWLWKREWSN